MKLKHELEGLSCNIESSLPSLFACCRINPARGGFTKQYHCAVKVDESGWRSGPIVRWGWIGTEAVINSWPSIKSETYHRKNLSRSIGVCKPVDNMWKLLLRWSFSIYLLKPSLKCGDLANIWIVHNGLEDGPEILNSTEWQLIKEILLKGREAF